MKVKAKVEDVKYPMTDKHDDLKSILNKIGVHNNEEDNADVAHDDDEQPEFDNWHMPHMYMCLLFFDEHMILYMCMLTHTLIFSQCIIF